MVGKLPGAVDIQVGDRIRAIRCAKRVTQARLGQAIGLSFQQVQKYETGASRISCSKLAAIAAYLMTPVQTFFDAPSTEQPLARPKIAELFDVQGARALLEAFRTIDDEAQRESVLALVQTLARVGDRVNLDASRL